jgi:carboxyl-terminal processing protease
LITNDVDALEDEFNGVSKIFGISYIVAYTDSSKTSVGLFLSYVVRNSPAEKAGFQRGDIILKINGQQLTTSNYTTLLASGETLTFSFGTMTAGTLATNGKEISVTRAEVSENPVAFSAVIDKSQYGKKIGYLVYTQFIPGTTADANEYDDELRTIFANFKVQGVNELVLDLRFNPGGYISSAETLASLIGKNISTSKIFYKEQWNDSYQAYLEKMQGGNALKHNFLNEANNIGANLNRVFVLTSNGTASASELVINGLTPYMSVITVGEHTYGKNLFGSLLSDDLSRWKWGLYIMLGQTANAKGESDYGTVNGITPTYQIKDNTVPFLSFGDDNETLFRKVLEVMGVPTSTSARTAATKTISSLSGEHFKENLVTKEKPLIRKIIKAE